MQPILSTSGGSSFGTNPNGEPLFAMRTHGTGLRQLTQALGMVVEPDGTSVELSNPMEYVVPLR